MMCIACVLEHLQKEFAGSALPSYLNQSYQSLKHLSPRERAVFRAHSQELPHRRPRALRTTSARLSAISAVGRATLPVDMPADPSNPGTGLAAGEDRRGDLGRFPRHLL